MKLRSLRVEGWRCYTGPVELAGFSDRLNVIHGPNGSGKSTLLWALARGLFDWHGSKAADIKSLTPWGTALAPQVAIEFDHQGERYRLEKSFLRSSRAELARWDEGDFSPVAQGKQAEDVTRRLLSGEEPRGGAKGQKHWGYAQVLWATQGELRIGELSDGTRSTIQESLGAQVGGGGLDSIETEVARRYEALFTPGGKYKGGKEAPAVERMREELSAARRRAEELRGELADFEQAQRQIEDLACSVRHAEENSEALRERWVSTSLLGLFYEKLVAAAEQLRESIATNRERYEAIQREADEVADLRRQQTELEDQKRRLDEQRPLLDSERSSAQEAADRAEAELRDVRRRRCEPEERRREAAQADAFTRTREQLRQCRELQARATSAARQRQELLAQRRAIVAPDRRRLEAIRAAARELLRLRDKLEAAMLAVAVEAESPIELDLSAGEEQGIRRIAAGETAALRGTAAIAFRIPGVGRFRLTGPAASAEELRQGAAEAEQELASLLSGMPTRDIDELARRSECAAELERSIERETERMTAILGAKTLESLDQEILELEATAAETVSDHPHWNESPPNAAALAFAAERMAESFQQELERRESAREASQSKLRMTENSLSEHLTQVELCQAALCEKRRRLDVFGHESDNDRRARLTTVAMQGDAADAKLQLAQEKLTAFAGDPRQELDTLQRQCKSHDQEAAAARRRLHHEEGRLQEIIARAPATALAAVEEEIERLEEEVAREDAKNYAIRLLHEMICSQRKSAVEAVLAPVHERSLATLRRIAGGDFESIEFGDDFQPKGISPRRHDAPVAIDYLSGGEQEQVHFAVRLALADAAFGGQRNLLVLDDAFAATDTARLARIINILQEAADRFQVVLLSCHPERYRHLDGAQFFDLEQLKQSGRRARQPAGAGRRSEEDEAAMIAEARL